MNRNFPQFRRAVALIMLVVLATGCTSLYDRNKPIVALDVPSLRDIYADYFDVGVAVSLAGWSPQTFANHQDLIEWHFNSLTAENEMKPDALQPREGAFSFSTADKMVDYAVDNNLKVRGHTLVWHNQTPAWFFRDEAGDLIHEKPKEAITEADRELVKRRLEEHIEQVMTHYAGKVYAWDVVNEAVSDDYTTTHRPDSPWYIILGEDFMRIAFTKAHEVDPEAKLFYNDYNPEMYYKRGRTIDMLKSLLDEGVPIHGIGIQGHWSANGLNVSESEIEESIRMYAELGLEIHITELDVGRKGATEAQQAEAYRQLFRMFKRNSDVITSVTFWGTTDDVSWRRDENPLLFDAKKQPKPAFWAIVDTEKPWQQNRDEYLRR